MRRFGRAIGFAAAVLGAGFIAQTCRADDDPWGLASYNWSVSWNGQTSTWCFHQNEDGTYYGDEIGMGAAHANFVAYDTQTHVLEMNATSSNNNDTAQYTWTMEVDANGLPVENVTPGAIVFSRWVDPDTKRTRTDPLTEEAWITRGESRPSATCH